MEEKVEEKLINLAHLITGFTICAFTLGILYQTVYYAFFNFNVFEYTELNEIIIHVIKIAVIITIPYIILFFLGLALSNKKIMVTNNDWSKRKTKNFKIFNLIALIIFISYVVYQFVCDKISFPLFIFFNLTFFTSYLLGVPKILKRIIPEIFGITIDAYSYLYLIALVISIYGALMTSLINVDSVKYGFSTKGTYIIVDKDTIKSDSSYYYIGKTNKYFFFYNKKKSFVDIYPEREVKKISLK